MTETLLQLYVIAVANSRIVEKELLENLSYSRSNKIPDNFC